MTTTRGTFRAPNGITVSTPNVTEEGKGGTVELWGDTYDDYYISYNNVDTDHYGSDTTALVLGNKQRTLFLILNGDHREGLRNAEDMQGALDYYNAHPEHHNEFTEDEETTKKSKTWAAEYRKKMEEEEAIEAKRGTPTYKYEIYEEVYDEDYMEYSHPIVGNVIAESEDHAIELFVAHPNCEYDEEELFTTRRGKALDENGMYKVPAVYEVW